MDNELLGKLVQSIGALMTGVEIQIGYTAKDSSRTGVLERKNWRWRTR